MTAYAGYFESPQDGQIYGLKNGVWTPVVGGGGGSGALTLFATQTIAVAAANIQFASIPATYKDLFLSIVARGTTAAAVTTLQMRFNADTAANYDNVQTNVNNNAIAGNNFVAQTSGLLMPVPASTANANKAAYGTVDILGYTNTSFEKGFVSQGYQGPTANTVATQRMQDHGGSWRNTAAITQIDLFLAAGNFEVGITISLYGRG